MASEGKSQKRQFVRLQVVLPVKYRQYTGNPIFLKNFDVGRTNDLSSGGMSIVVSKPLAPGLKLDIELELDDATRPYIVGKVLEGNDIALGKVSRRIEKITFLELDQEAQDMIMKYIFESQRKVVRKGKRERSS